MGGFRNPIPHVLDVGEAIVDGHDGALSATTVTDGPSTGLRIKWTKHNGFVADYHVESL